MYRTKTILAICEDVERQYNLAMSWLGECDYSDIHEKRIEKILKLYRETCETLKELGIGGVLINGIFRNLSL